MKTLTTAFCLVGVSLVAPPTTFAQRETHQQRQPNSIRNRNQGSITWSGHVDQVMDVSFQQGRTWNKRINGRKGSGEAVFSTSIPRKSVHMTVNQSLGRGKVSIEEQPSRSNGYTCVVRIADRRSGGDQYKFTLTWNN